MPEALPGTLSPKIVLKNKFNQQFEIIINCCTTDPSFSNYNPYRLLRFAYDTFKKFKTSINKQEKTEYSHYLNWLKDFFNAQGHIFTEFKIPKIYEYDPVYLAIADRQKLVSDKHYRNTIFKKLRARYHEMYKIINNLHLTHIAPETKTFLYNITDTTLDQLLIKLTDFIKSPSVRTDPIITDLFDTKGILKVLADRTATCPQLSAMPSCLKQPTVLKLLNRYLMFYPSGNLKPVFDEGLNYLIHSIDNQNNINREYLTLAKAYYQIMRSADLDAILVNADCDPVTLNDFNCKRCVNLKNNNLRQFPQILREAAKVLKNQSEPEKRALARFCIYTIQLLKRYNTPTDIQGLSEFMHSLMSITSKFTNAHSLRKLAEVMDQATATKNLTTDEDSNLRRKIDKQNAGFVECYLSLVNQRAQVMHFHKQLHYEKNPTFYGAFDPISNLSVSVLYKAREILDAEALEMVCVANELSTIANELLIHTSPEDTENLSYIFKSKLDPLIIKCHLYLKCGLTLPSMPALRPCFPEHELPPVKTCAGLPDTSVIIPLCGGILDDYNNIIPYCGTGDLIKSETEIRPCNHSIISASPGAIEPDKKPATEKTDTPHSGEADSASTDLPPLTEDKGKIKPPLSINEQNEENRRNARTKAEQRKFKTLREAIENLIKHHEIQGTGSSIEEIVKKLQNQIENIEDTLSKSLNSIDGTDQKSRIAKPPVLSRTEKNLGRLSLFDGLNLPARFQPQWKSIKKLMERFKNTEGALATDGPIERITCPMPEGERIQGALYELMVAAKHERLGLPVKALHKELVILEEQRELWETAKQTVEFDIELENGTFIEVKNIDWKFVEDYFSIIDMIKEYNWLNDLDSLRTSNSEEVKKLLQANHDTGIVGKTMRDMYKFLHQAKTGNEMAKSLNKQYLFYSNHAIPPVIKKWLIKHAINFSEKNCENCPCDRKYRSGCRPQ